jgi:hypothetical protein
MYPSVMSRLKSSHQLVNSQQIPCLRVIHINVINHYKKRREGKKRRGKKKRKGKKEESKKGRSFLFTTEETQNT